MMIAGMTSGSSVMNSTIGAELAAAEPDEVGGRHDEQDAERSIVTSADRRVAEAVLEARSANTTV
jgi:hypothetical protein